MNSSPSITAIVLAGGLGTRLRSVVFDRPKVLVRVGGKPFLHYILDQLSACGTGNVILCCGYMGNQIEEEIGDSYGRISISYSHEEQLLGTGGAVRNAIPLVNSRDILVMNGDSYIDIDLYEFLDWYLKEDTVSAALVVNIVRNIAAFGSVVLSGDRKIIRFVEKTGINVPGNINAGVYMFRKKLFEDISINTKFSLERELFPRLASDGILKAYPVDCGFIDIGTPDSFAGAETFFEQVKKKEIMNHV